MANEQIAVELRIKNKQLANDLRQSNAELAKLKKSFVELGNTGAKAEAQMAKMGRSSAQASKSLASMATVLRAVAVYSAGQAIGRVCQGPSGYAASRQRDRLRLQ